MLQAGIDVFSTVNVQHLESLNDQVAELTGIKVRETVPDEELAKADEIVLVDLPPEDLITRLRAGKVYPQARIAPALNGFFRVENLRALREVALRQLAENVEDRRVDEQPIAERLLAFVTPRRARRARGPPRVALRPAPQRRARRARRRRARAVRRAARAAGGAAAADRDARRAPAGRGRATSSRSSPASPASAGRPTSCSARRRRGGLGEPLLLQILRELPDVDVRVVAQR